MMQKFFWLVIIIALFFSPFQVSAGTRALQVTEQYFPETGHWVRGSFLEFFNAAPNPLLLYGYPITEAFLDPHTRILMQYFERARFELATDENGNTLVILSPLGEYIYRAASTKPVKITKPASICQEFITPDGGLSVCFGFLKFFNQFGGVAQFGLPVSELVLEGDTYVQYFQNARFEWRPGKITESWVKLTDIGTIQFNLALRDPALLKADPGFAPYGEVINLAVSAFISEAVVNLGSRQTLTVVVQDQNALAIKDASVSVIIHLPNGLEMPTSMPPTDENGISHLTLYITDLPINSIVTIDVKAVYQKLEATTQTRFRIWY